MQREVPDAELAVDDLELGDLCSVRQFADRVGSTLDRADLLVNNAGLYGVPTHRSTAQGFEQQFEVNHLGHFALTGLLLPPLRQAPDARVVTVSSLVYWFASLDLDDLQMDAGYRRHRAYGRSKLANILFAVELEKRLRRADSQVRSVAAHPGMTNTRLVVNGPGIGGGGGTTRALDAINAAISPYVHEKVERGVRPLLHAAVAEDVTGGAYYGPRYTLRGAPTRVTLPGRALDAQTAARLWERSSDLTGVPYLA